MQMYKLWSPYGIGQAIIFSSCGCLYLLLLLLSFFPRLISAVADWMSAILPHANLECRSEVCRVRLAENAGPKKIAKIRHGHYRTTLLGYIFATKARIDNRKKRFKQQYLPPHVPTIRPALRLN